MSIFDLIFGQQQKVDTRIVDVQNFAITSATGGYRNPAWVCSRYPDAEVTFPESNLLTTFWAGTTGPQSAGTAHTHTLGVDTYNQAASANFNIVTDTSLGAYITISNPTVMDRAGFWSLKYGAVSACYFDLFRVNSDTSLTRIDSIEFSAQIPTVGTVGYIEVMLTNPLPVQGGERYVMRVRNASANTITIAAQGRSLVSPQTAFATVNATETNRTSLTIAQALTARTALDIMPWFMLAAGNVAATDQSFTDEFNRSSLGGLWVLKSTVSNLAISGNKVRFAGLTDGHQVGLYGRATNGDGMRTEFTVSENTFAISSAQLGGMVCCSRDFGQTVYLAINYNDVKIYSGAWNSLAQRATVTRSYNEGKWAFYYDVINNKYVGELEGAQVISWTDSGNVTLHGADYRFGGMRISRNTFVNAGAIDNVTIKDWTG